MLQAPLGTELCAWALQAPQLSAAPLSAMSAESAALLIAALLGNASIADAQWVPFLCPPPISMASRGC